MPGVVGSRQIGTRLEVVVVSFGPEHQKQVEILEPKRWENRRPESRRRVHRNTRAAPGNRCRFSAATANR